MLGNAAAPCALVVPGLFLAACKVKDEKPAVVITAFLMGSKRVIQPSLAWVLAVHVFGLSSFATLAAVLLAALLVGTGSFMLVELYRRDAQVSSYTIIFSTILSALTLAIILAVFA